MVFQIDVRLVDWPAWADRLTAIRREVFVNEQKVPESLEIDGRDPECKHAVALSANGTAIATGRLLPEGKIGRMAVLRQWRGQGVGHAIISCLIDPAKLRGDQEIWLSSQVVAIPFYERYGFTCQGDQYMEAGLPHQDVSLKLN